MSFVATFFVASRVELNKHFPRRKTVGKAQLCGGG